MKWHPSPNTAWLWHSPLSNAVAGILAGVALGGCAAWPEPPAASALALPEQFQALPPSAAQTPAQSASQLQGWWQQFDDPLVPELVQTALAHNPGLEQALARIAQARASVGQARSAVWPGVTANASATRTQQPLDTFSNSTFVATQTNRSLDASWEIDLFGAARNTAQAANARVLARAAEWHVARVSLAAEVASTLVGFRACKGTQALLAEDLQSRQQTMRLTGLKIKAGFAAPADAALIQGSVADAQQRLAAQTTDCELGVQALMDLTGLAQPELQAKLDHPVLQQATALPHPKAIAVDTVPAQVLQQRPDIAGAQLDVAAAWKEVDAAQARRYPQLSLAGNIGVTGVLVDGVSGSTDTWSFGPSLSLPLLDGGLRRANHDAALARLQEQEALYRQKVRSVVREVQEALLRLDGATRREGQAAQAASQYAHYFQDRSAQYQLGHASLFELEDARRTLLAARQTAIAVQRDQVLAWVALYKALGGGWQPDASTCMDPCASAPPQPL